MAQVLANIVSNICLGMYVANTMLPLAFAACFGQERPLLAFVWHAWSNDVSGGEQR